MPTPEQPTVDLGPWMEKAETLVEDWETCDGNGSLPILSALGLPAYKRADIADDRGALVHRIATLLATTNAETEKREREAMFALRAVAERAPCQFAVSRSLGNDAPRHRDDCDRCAALATIHTTRPDATEGTT